MTTSVHHPWTWLLLDERGQGSRRSDGFESRGDAESWLGETYRSLVEEGVDQAQLLCDDEPIGAPLSLTSGR